MTTSCSSRRFAQGARPVTEPCSALPTATVEVVIPVYNEESALPGCVTVLSRYLENHCPLDWSVTVVDNGSNDRTGEVADRIAGENPRVRATHLAGKGKGRAIRTAWLASTADIVAYMDVDLSTDLDAFLPLVAPLISGHSEIAIGSRLAAGARVRRGPRREMISRGYNSLIHLSHGARFSDGQCGFKAARRAAVAPLLPHVEADGWFFDTELLLLAEYNHLRIHEVPVDWIEDPDSRVRILETAWEDLRGLVRVARARANGSAWIDEVPRRPMPLPRHSDGALRPALRAELWPVISFLCVGVISTVLTVLLYAAFRAWWPPLSANLASLVLATLFNTEANRRVTFPGAGGSTPRVHVHGLVVFVLYYLFTSGALIALQSLVAHPARPLELTVLLGAYAAGTAGRFFLLRNWIFRSSHARSRS